MISIRHASLSDHETIVSYNLALARETESLELNSETVRRGVDAILSDFSKGHYFVAEISGDVVGQVMITFEWSDWRNGNIWWLQSVYVRPDFRAKGVFRQLFYHVCAEAKRTPDVCAVRLYMHNANRVARKVYGRLGFVATEYQVFELGSLAV